MYMALLVCGIISAFIGRVG